MLPIEALGSFYLSIIYNEAAVIFCLILCLTILSDKLIINTDAAMQRAGTIGMR
jgi:hypothetical protein